MQFYLQFGRTDVENIHPFRSSGGGIHLCQMERKSFRWRLLIILWTFPSPFVHSLGLKWVNRNGNNAQGTRKWKQKDKKESACIAWLLKSGMILQYFPPPDCTYLSVPSGNRKWQNFDNVVHTPNPRRSYISEEDALTKDFTFYAYFLTRSPVSHNIIICPSSNSW